MKIDKRKIRQWKFKVNKDLLTWHNILVVLAVFLAVNWFFSGVKSIERNYKLQRKINHKKSELRLLELQTINLENENEYYKTEEYQDLALRQNMNKIGKGEKVFVVKLDQNWIEQQKKLFETKKIKQTKLTNFQKWMLFFSGKRHKKS